MIGNNQVEQKEDPWSPPCIVEGIPFSDYLAIDAASSHALGTLINKSPLHVKAAEDKPSAAKGLGTVAHALILEPDSVNDQIAVQPENCGKGSNAAKAALVDWIMDVTGATEPLVNTSLAPGKQLDAKLKILEPVLGSTGKTVCSQEMWNAAQRMRDSVMSKDIGRTIFVGGIGESTGLAVDPESEVFCKIRPDWLPDGHDVICDLKTAVSASYDEFARAAARYGYHVQAAFYRKIRALITGEPRPSFLHVVVENTPPYDCAFYELDKKAIDAGDQFVRRALQIWGICEKSSAWPGIGYDYSEEEYRIESLSLPKWAL